MTNSIKNIIRLLAEQQRFDAPDDHLSVLTETGEFSEDELDLVAAAAAVPSFQQLLEQAKQR